MFWRIRRFFLGITYALRSIVFFAKYGFRREDMWSLDDAIAKWIAPRLRYFAEHTNSFPAQFGTMAGQEHGYELWTAMLHKMADGFELMTKPEWDSWDKDQVALVDESLELFANYFFNLWD